MRSMEFRCSHGPHRAVVELVSPARGFLLEVRLYTAHSDEQDAVDECVRLLAWLLTEGAP